MKFKCRVFDAQNRIEQDIAFRIGVADPDKVHTGGQTGPAARFGVLR
jgi:hypothetical protein